MSEQRYPNYQLLVSPDWLAEHLDDPNIRIVEVTPPGAGYTLGHIRGAVFWNLDLAFEGSQIDVERVAAQLSELGLSRDQLIVLYDEIGGQRAGQAFWMLEYLGFDNVVVLEGGSERWMAEGQPETRVVPTFTPTKIAPNVRTDRLATADWLAARLKDDQVIVVDARTPTEFAEGHIPGARNFNWERALKLQAYQRFRDADELSRELTELGATDGRELVTYCGSGWRSAHTYLTLRLMGYPSVRNYKGSWDEWGNRVDLPKEKG